MDAISTRINHVALGHSAQSDSFQCGREAAQSAKGQLRDSSAKLSLAIGPDSAHIQDFIEGVRLVTGDAGLIGVPGAPVLTNDFFLPESRLVCLIQSDALHMSSASVTTDHVASAGALTSLLSQHRMSRGNACHQFSERGLLLFDNAPDTDVNALLHQATVEFGLDGWIVAIHTAHRTATPLFCNDTVVTKGLVGIECLSESRVGIGSVGIGEFDRHSPVVREAAKAALREARARMESPVSIAMLFFDFDIDAKIASEIQMDFRRDEIREAVLVAFRTNSHGSKYAHRTGSAQRQSITALLLPL